jgi:hypothetical protein
MLCGDISATQKCRFTKTIGLMRLILKQFRVPIRCHTRRRCVQQSVRFRRQPKSERNRETTKIAIIVPKQYRAGGVVTAER